MLCCQCNVVLAAREVLLTIIVVWWAEPNLPLLLFMLFMDNSTTQW